MAFSEPAGGTIVLVLLYVFWRGATVLFVWSVVNTFMRSQLACFWAIFPVVKCHRTPNGKKALQGLRQLVLNNNLTKEFRSLQNGFCLHCVNSQNMFLQNWRGFLNLITMIFTDNYNYSLLVPWDGAHKITHLTVWFWPKCSLYKISVNW